jgi:hypothetical protein
MQGAARDCYCFFWKMQLSKERARDLSISDNRVVCVQSDITTALVFKENSLDVVAAHFSIYTIRENDKRQ